MPTSLSVYILSITSSPWWYEDVFNLYRSWWRDALFGWGGILMCHILRCLALQKHREKSIFAAFVLPLRNPPPPLTKHLSYGTILLYQYMVRGGVAVRGNSELRVQTDLPPTCPDPIPISKGGEYEICSSVWKWTFVSSVGCKAENYLYLVFS